MEGLQRWSIEIGPDCLRAGHKVEFGICLELVSGTGIMSRHLLRLQLYDVQPIEGTATMVTFQSGRLFGSGEITTVWGTYDTATMKGDLWLLTVPRPYTGYYASRFGG